MNYSFKLVILEYNLSQLKAPNKTMFNQYRCNLLPVVVIFIEFIACTILKIRKHINNARVSAYCHETHSLYSALTNTTRRFSAYNWSVHTAQRFPVEYLTACVACTL